MIGSDGMQKYVQCLFCLVLVLMIGCAAKILDGTTLQYIAPSFSYESISTQGIALLEGDAGFGQEGFRRPIANALNKRLVEAMEHKPFLDSLQTMSRINDANLSQPYAKLMGDFERTAILDQKVLAQIGDATQVRYLLHVKLLDQTSLSLDLFGQVWDTHLGDVVWEVRGKVEVLPADDPKRNPPQDHVVDYTACTFLNRLPGFMILLPENPSARKTTMRKNAAPKPSGYGFDESPVKKGRF